MLSILGKPSRNCEGVTRRDFLRIGTAGFGGLTLAGLLSAEASAGIATSKKAVINIHLDGGPPQMDTIDLKPNAPAEIRGEFGSIGTSLSGFRICELMPKTASIAKELVFIRSLVGADNQHNAFQCQSGFDAKDLVSVGGRPAMGSIVAKLLSEQESDNQAPAFVDMMQGRPLARNSARPGFLGPTYQPFRPDMSRWFKRELEEGMKKELAKLGANHTTNLKLHTSLDASRLNNRADLLGQLDQVRKEVDAKGMMTAVDQFHAQAANILTSGKLAAALDISKEDPKIVDHYTPPINRNVSKFVTAEDEYAMRKLLLARRLIEAGARCVSVSYSDFDTHKKNFPRLRQMLPIIDHGLWALFTDLKQRGMLDDVSVVAWGEFGRTPKVNKDGGRDHWPKVGPAILFGGGMRGGQVIGSTDRMAAEAVSRPVHYQDVMATLYNRLGIDASQTTVLDPTGRPQFVLDHGEPIQEIV